MEHRCDEIDTKIDRWINEVYAKNGKESLRVALAVENMEKKQEEHHQTSEANRKRREDKEFARTWQIVGLSLAVIGSIIGYIISSDNGIKDDLKTTVIELQNKAERLSGVEATVIGLDKKLEDINGKLDFIITPNKNR